MPPACTTNWLIMSTSSERRTSASACSSSLPRRRLKQQSGWGEQKPALAKDKVFSVQWQVSAVGADYDLWIDNVRLTCE